MLLASLPASAGELPLVLPLPGMAATAAPTPAAPVPVAVPLNEAPATPERVVIDVRSRHSDGAHDFGTLIGLARLRGIDVLGFGEHDRFTIRLGIDPIPQWLGYSMNHPSLYETGLERFFTDLQRVRAAYPDIGIMAGTESIPGYYWSGLPLRNLTLHDAERHIITLGLARPEQVEALPSYTLANIRGSHPLSMLFWSGVVVLLLFVTMISSSRRSRIRRRRRVAQALLFISLGLISYWWLKPVPHPDADFIAAAHKQGLFVVWAHPGTLSGISDGPMGVKLDTRPYSQRVFEQPTADGFAAVYGDTDTNTVPGGLWDGFMMAYLKGYMPAPIWGVAAGDYHEEGEAGEYLGNFPMDVWAASRDPKVVLAAIRQGRMTAWHQPRDRNLFCRALYLQTADGRKLLPGTEATLPGAVRLVAALGEWHRPGAPVSQPAAPLRAQWIVDGEVAAEVMLAPDSDTATMLPLTLAPGPHVVRLHIPVQPPGGIRMEANPFLLRVTH